MSKAVDLRLSGILLCFLHIELLPKCIIICHSSLRSMMDEGYYRVFGK